MTIQHIRHRFRITPLEGSCDYRMSIPDYEGGEVVTAEHHDAEIERLRAALREIEALECHDGSIYDAPKIACAALGEEWRG